MYDKDVAAITAQIVSAVIQSGKLPTYDVREIASYYRDIYKQVLAGGEPVITANNSFSE